MHRIAIENGVVKYLLNGVVKYTSTQAATYPLFVSSTIEIVGHSVQNVVIGRGTTGGTGSGGTGGTGSGGTGGTGSGGTGGTGSGGTGGTGSGALAARAPAAPAAPAPAHRRHGLRRSAARAPAAGGTGSGSTGGTGSGGTGGTGSTGGTQNVVWASPLRVAVAGNNITKSSGCDGCWDSGAISQQTISSGNGYVEFKTSAGPWLAVGLSNGNPGTTITEIAYALKFFGGYVEVREKGIYKAGWNVVAGDVHKVAVDNGVVKYFLNGVVKYVSTTAPTYPLLVDSTIELVGHAVQNAVISN